MLPSLSSAALLGIFLAQTYGNTLAIGGPKKTKEAPRILLSAAELQGELSVLMKKEEILKEHFSSLQSEEGAIDREAAALQRAIDRIVPLPADASMEERRAQSVKKAAMMKRANDLMNVKMDIRAARTTLTALTKNKTEYEKLLVASYRAATLAPKSKRKGSLRRPAPGTFAFAWPVADRSRGISAGFLDPSYKDRFGFAHEAVDIPVQQGTTVYAPAAGRVLEVNDRGYGYNTLVLEHADGMTTVYGHVGTFLVSQGDVVHKGDPIALSGGRPGSKGAGLLTTGPHLHFEMRADGEAVDPLVYLPPSP